MTAAGQDDQTGVRDQPLQDKSVGHRDERVIVAGERSRLCDPGGVEDVESDMVDEHVDLGLGAG